MNCRSVHLAGKGPVPGESPRVYPCEADGALIHGSPFRIWKTGRYS